MSTRRAELVRYYRWLRQYGLNDSHSGNASCRDGDSVWMTPTGCCADTLVEDMLIHCSVDEPAPEGATLDAALHLAVYLSVPDCAAVLHSHGPHTIAVTMSGDDFEPVDFEGRYYFGSVPVICIDDDRYLEESPAKVSRALAGNRIAVVRGHGSYAGAASLDLAYKWACSLESSARIAWLAQGPVRLREDTADA